MMPSSVFDYTNVDPNACTVCTVFLWCHETLHRSASSFLNSNNLSKILTYYNRNVAENDKVSLEEISERGVHNRAVARKKFMTEAMSMEDL